MSADVTPTPSDLARRLCQSRPIVSGKCQVCRKEFQGAPNRRYCSDRCRWYSYRHRERAAEFAIPYELQAIFQGSAAVYLDEDGYYWVQLKCAPQGPKKGDPARPATPEPITLEVSYYALFR